MRENVFRIDATPSYPTTQISFGKHQSSNDAWEAGILQVATSARQGRFQASLALASITFLSASLYNAYYLYRRGYRRSIELLYRPPLAYEIILQLVIGSAAILSLILSIQAIVSTLDSLLIGYVFMLRFFHMLLPGNSQIGSVLQKGLDYHSSKLLGLALLLALVGDVLPSILIRYTLPRDPHIVVKDVLLALAVAILLGSPRKVVRFEHEIAMPRIWNTTDEVDDTKKLTDLSPEQICRPFSYWVTYGWLDKVILRGWKRDLCLNDLPSIPYYDEPLIWLSKILEARQLAFSTLKTCAYLVRWELFTMWTCAVAVGCFELMPAFALNRLITFIEKPTDSVFKPGVWVALLFFSSMAHSICFHQYIFVATRLRVRIKMSLVQEIFCRTLDSINLEGPPSKILDASNDGVGPDESATLMDEQFSKSAHSEPAAHTGIGHILNLMSTDVNGVEEGRELCFIFGALPVILTLGIFFLARLVGSFAAMSGLCVLVVGLALPGIFTRKMTTSQHSVMQASDLRIAMISEFVSSIRIIKYFGWEPPMAARIHKRRDLEQIRIWKCNLWSAASTWVAFTAPFTALFVILAVHTLTGEQLSAATAFTCMTILNNIRAMGVWISEVTSKFSQCWVACKRLDRFYASSIPQTHVLDGTPGFSQATLLRSPHGDFRLEDLDIRFLPGRLNIVTGPTGCGKTSLLLSLLGETILESGTVTCSPNVGYVAQNAFLQSGTVRDNITFHSEYDELNYIRTIKACGLEPDFHQFPRGDLTDIAEQGVLLSGGQQQRVALARAIYSSASTLLLDDIFSALDVHTAKHIFDELFRTNILAGRTIILTSHSQVLIDSASLVMTMKNGAIESVIEKEAVPKTSLSTVPSEGTRRIALEARSCSPDIPSLHQRKLEETATGRLPRLLIFRYMTHFGGLRTAALALILAIVAQTLFFGTLLWLSVWTNAYDRDGAVNIAFYLGIYALLLFGYEVVFAIFLCVTEYGSFKAASKLHNRLVQAIMGLDVRWFDHQPIGTIINRFSRDMQSLDSILATCLRRTMEACIRLTFAVASIASILPVFAIPTLVLCFLGVYVGEIYIRASSSVKRLVSATQSPLFAHFSDTLTGITTIRAKKGMKDVYKHILADRLRDNAKALEALYNANRWIGMRSESIANLIATMAGLVSLQKANSVTAGLVGLSLSNAVTLSLTMLQLARASNEMEIELSSLQRIFEYTELKSEKEAIKRRREKLEGKEASEKTLEVPASWPSRGEIRLRNFSAAYTEDSADVIKKMNLIIQPGERIGIVGRTGSGKTSFSLSMLGFTLCTGGSITIDGIDIAKIDLATLRRQVTLIPQDPVLFQGDVRTNLDIFNEMDDSELEQILHACTSFQPFQSPDSHDFNTSESAVRLLASIPKTQKTRAHAESRLALSTPISRNGENISRGERQIISMARALCRRSKIVLLDEATSSVDEDTDAQIQQVLRTGFRDSTIITIAHRLKTVMDYDRVIVLDEGVIVECGRPRDLMEKRGIFWEMLDETGERDELSTKMKKS